jgi:hypothetical protein
MPGSSWSKPLSKSPAPPCTALIYCVCGVVAKIIWNTRGTSSPWAHEPMPDRAWSTPHMTESTMRHSKTGRIIAISASAFLLLALGCGLLGLAVQQRVMTLTDINMQLGPLSIITHAPRSSVCPEKADPLANVCDRFSAIPGPASYRILLFWSTLERGPQSTRVLAHWTLPLRDESRN